MSEQPDREGVDREPSHSPRWVQVEQGPLRDRWLYLADDLPWQREMIAGEDDTHVLDRLDRAALRGATVLDVGGHIGYHALVLAELVGPEGHVISFEPNVHNRRRMEMILERNPDLSERIRIEGRALSDRAGSTTLEQSDAVDSGHSSGSFIHGSETPYRHADYATLGFQRAEVEATTLDRLLEEERFPTPPRLVKIDVEGAEKLVLDGGRAFLARCRPELIVELHGLGCTLPVLLFLAEVDYEVEFLGGDAETRQFIRARPVEEGESAREPGTRVLEVSRRIIATALEAVRVRDERLVHLAELESEREVVLAGLREIQALLDVGAATLEDDLDAALAATPRAGEAPREVGDPLERIGRLRERATEILTVAQELQVRAHELRGRRFLRRLWDALRPDAEDPWLPPTRSPESATRSRGERPREATTGRAASDTVSDTVTREP